MGMGCEMWGVLYTGGMIGGVRRSCSVTTFFFVAPRMRSRRQRAGRRGVHSDHKAHTRYRHCRSLPVGQRNFGI